MKKILIIIPLAALVSAVIYALNAPPPMTAVSENKNTALNEETQNSSANPASFSNPKKSAHYESNTPAHGSALAGVPINVVIDFNFDLAKPSEIKIFNNGRDYSTGETIIDDNSLSMRRNLSTDAPDGMYTVEYRACWPDQSCHDGNFQFTIDNNRAIDFENRTDSNEVVIRMSEIRFNPQKIRVAKGTKITWINDDEEDHYVNTDSHPAHTYYLPQNSQNLEKGDQFSLVFDTPGIYPYHCSAHASTMAGILLVE